VIIFESGKSHYKDEISSHVIIDKIALNINFLYKIFYRLWKSKGLQT